jgi:hypothetical protein
MSFHVGRISEALSAGTVGGMADYASLIRPTIYAPQTKTEALLPPFSFSPIVCALPEPSRRMREQGVDEAGLRGQMAAQY